jgi:hypothetical protein
MKRSLRLVLTILVGSGALIAGAAPASSGHSTPAPAPASFEACPTHLIAPYGGTDGWSTINVQANFARAFVTPSRMMTCQYRFGAGAPFFGIQKPCPVGSRCIAVRNGFRIVP